MTGWQVVTDRHVALIAFDEVAAEVEAGGWLVVCETCDARTNGYDPASSIGYYRTERAANAAAAEHQLEAGPRTAYT